LSTTNASAVTTAITTKIQKKLLDKNVGDWHWTEWGQKTGPVEVGHDTVRKNKIIQPADMTSSMSEGAQYSDFTAKALKTEKVEASFEQMADLFEFTDRVDLLSLVDRDDMIEEIAKQYKRSLSRDVCVHVATNCLRHRQDNDSTYEVTGTADSGSTTTLVDDALTQNDDAWNGGFLTITNPTGTNYDVTRKVSDFANSGDTVTCAAFNHAIDSTSKYKLTVGTGIAATDVFTIAGLIRVRGSMGKMQIPKFDDGTYIFPIDSEITADIWSDTTFSNTAIYDDSKRYKKYDVGRWLDVVFPLCEQIHREDVDGTANWASGVVRVPVCLGKNMYDVLHWGNAKGRGNDALKRAFSVNVYLIDKPDSVNVAATKWWVSWKANYAKMVNRATAGIGLMCGATAMPVVV
jgi:hypothetical protein